MTPPAPVVKVGAPRPWTRTVRTVLQAAVGLCGALPLIYQAATGHNPAEAVGGVSVALGAAAAVSRVMATPTVETWLRRFVPWLAATPPTGGTP